MIKIENIHCSIKYHERKVAYTLGNIKAVCIQHIAKSVN